MGCSMAVVVLLLFFLCVQFMRLVFDSELSAGTYIFIKDRSTTIDSITTGQSCTCLYMMGWHVLLCLYNVTGWGIISCVYIM